MRVRTPIYIMYLHTFYLLHSVPRTIITHVTMGMKWCKPEKIILKIKCKNKCCVSTTTTPAPSRWQWRRGGRRTFAQKNNEHEKSGRNIKKYLLQFEKSARVHESGASV